MKLSQWAKKQGIHYNTAYTWFKQGKIPNATQLDTGTIIINEVDNDVNKKLDKIEKRLEKIEELLYNIIKENK